MHGCPDCGSALETTTRDHLYGYDHGEKILLRGVTVWTCACGYHEVEIPKMGPLHEAIRQALDVLRTKRADLALVFSPGDRGVPDGAWGVVVRGAS